MGKIRKSSLSAQVQVRELIVVIERSGFRPVTLILVTKTLDESPMILFSRETKIGSKSKAYVQISSRRR
jgi:hypothetical protein